MALAAEQPFADLVTDEQTAEGGGQREVGALLER